MLVTEALAAAIGFSLASLLTDSMTAGAICAVIIVVSLTGPAGLVAGLRVRRLTHRADALSDARQRRVDAAGQHQEFASVIADALDMTNDEPEALVVIQRAFESVLPDQPVELLLADNSHAHLIRKAFTAPNGSAPGCEVVAPKDCPAARRARVQDFPDSDAINACPRLQDRAVGRCSASCIPVSMMGRTVGVIHTVAPIGSTAEEAALTDLRTVAAQAGTRLGVLRIMAETHLQASTDGLTGLMNRRTLDNSYSQLRGSTSSQVVAMADLDRFKQLNDTHGHATGDRALRIFAQTLQETLRAEDLICRRGGEEFAIVFPDCSSESAVAALNRVQTQLQAALALGGLPRFTASFGVVDALGEDLESTLARADIALFAAKAAGRDHITVHDQHGVKTISIEPEVLTPVLGHVDTAPAMGWESETI